MKSHNLLSGKTKIVDLSQIISGDTTIYPGDPVPQMKPLSTVKHAGTRTTLLTLGTHSGTHVDTPSHVLDDKRTVDTLPLDAFFGRAWVFDVAYKAQGSPVLPDDLATSAPLAAGDIALIYTGSNNKHRARPRLQPHVYLDESAAEWLIDKDVKAIGVDSLSVDRYDSETFGVHRKLLSHNVVLFENLSSNLQLLVGRHVLFFGVPLRLKAAEASPIRAFAVY